MNTTRKRHTKYTHHRYPNARVTIRFIEGKPECFLDVGCDDLVKAKANRERVANREITTWWVEMEARLKALPKNNPFPSSIPFSTAISGTI